MASKDIGAIAAMISIICGLGIGWRLAQAGENVTVYDRGTGAIWLGVDHRC